MTTSKKKGGKKKGSKEGFEGYLRKRFGG